MRNSRDIDTDDLTGNFPADAERPGHLDRAWKTIKRIVDSGECKDASIHY